MEKELRAFIACGDSRQGFAVARCEACQKRLLVPLSCKRRGICGSCIARRMCDAAAHLVDHVFPGNVPVRQWVISAPFELRLLLARDATAYGAVTRIFAEEVLGWYARRAVERGIVEHPRDARGAAVTAQQRWGSSLNLHPHIHAAFVDGVFTRAVPAQTEAQTQTETETQTQTASNATVSERAVFHTLLAPTSADLESIVLRIHARVLRWLRHRGFISDEQPFSNDRPEPAALDVFSQAALGVGRLQHVEPHEIAEMPAACSDCDADALEARFLPKSSGSRRAGANGWSLHAGTTVARGDRDALERLLRYFTRPPLAQARSLVP